MIFQGVNCCGVEILDICMEQLYKHFKMVPQSLLLILLIFILFLILILLHDHSGMIQHTVRSSVTEPDLLL